MGRLGMSSVPTGSRGRSAGGLALLAAALLAGAPASSAASALRWRPSPPMIEDRDIFGTATGADGRIYAFNGEWGIGAAEAFSPATRKWSSIAAPPDFVSGTAGAAANHGRIYEIGGLDFGEAAVRRVAVYTPWTNRWRHVAKMPTARAFVAAATGHDGRIYVFGGTKDILGGAPVLRTVEAYDPATDTWKARRPMPTARSGAAAVTGRDGTIYLIGGFDGSGFLNSVEAYDPATDTWRRRASMPTKRWKLGAAIGRDGRIYAVGGANASRSELRKVEAYSPATDTWSPAPFLFVPRSGLGVAAGKDGTVYAIGGCMGDCFFNHALDLVEALR
jgi:hypothetical protein